VWKRGARCRSPDGWRQERLASSTRITAFSSSGAALQRRDCGHVPAAPDRSSPFAEIALDPPIAPHESIGRQLRAAQRQHALWRDVDRERRLMSTIESCASSPAPWNCRRHRPL